MRSGPATRRSCGSAKPPHKAGYTYHIYVYIYVYIYVQNIHIYMYICILDIYVYIDASEYGHRYIHISIDIDLDRHPRAGLGSYRTHPRLEAVTNLHNIDLGWVLAVPGPAK